MYGCRSVDVNICGKRFTLVHKYYLNEILIKLIDIRKHIVAHVCCMSRIIQVDFSHIRIRISGEKGLGN